MGFPQNTNVSDRLAYAARNGTVGFAFPWYYVQVYATFVYSLIFFLGVCGNTLVVLVIRRTPSLHHSSIYMFLMNLSVADFLVLTFCLPNSVVVLFDSTWRLGAFLCSFLPYLQHVVTGVSVMTVVAISIERYLIMVWPGVELCGRTSKTIFNSGFTRFTICSIWMISLLMCTPFALMTKVVRRPNGDMKCVTSIAGDARRRTFVMGIFAVSYAFPLITLTVVYAHIGVHLHGKSKRTRHLKAILSTADKRNTQIVMMMVLLVLSFLLFLTPFRAFTIWVVNATRAQFVRVSQEFLWNLLHVCRMMHFLNSAVNPLIYNCASKQFRQAVTQSFLECFKQITGYQGFESVRRCSRQQCDCETVELKCRAAENSEQHVHPCCMTLSYRPSHCDSFPNVICHLQRAQDDDPSTMPGCYSNNAGREIQQEWTDPPRRIFHVPITLSKSESMLCIPKHYNQSSWRSFCTHTALSEASHGPYEAAGARPQIGRWTTRSVHVGTDFSGNAPALPKTGVSNRPVPFTPEETETKQPATEPNKPVEMLDGHFEHTLSLKEHGTSPTKIPSFKPDSSQTCQTAENAADLDNRCLSPPQARSRHGKHWLSIADSAANGPLIGCSPTCARRKLSLRAATCDASSPKPVTFIRAASVRVRRRMIKYLEKTASVDVGRLTEKPRQNHQHKGAMGAYLTNAKPTEPTKFFKPDDQVRRPPDLTALKSRQLASFGSGCAKKDIHSDSSACDQVLNSESVSSLTVENRPLFYLRDTVLDDGYV